MKKFYDDKGHGETIHGRADPGAVSGGLIEHDMNEVTGEAFAVRIREHGHECKVEPGDLKINESAAAANTFGADYCLSFHENAGKGNRGEVIYNWKPGADRLAAVAADGLHAAGQTKVNLVRSPANKDGTAEFFGMLRIPNMPAIIIEPCFIDNVDDRTLADTVDKQRHIGIFIADAMAAEYGSKLRQKVKIISGDHTLAGFLQDGKTMVPIKVFSVIEGFNYIWKATPQGIYIGVTFIPAVVVDDVGYAELRLITAAIGATIQWNGATMTATVI